MSLWGVVISAVYMLRAYRKIFKGPLTEKDAKAGFGDLTLAEKVPAVLLIIANGQDGFSIDNSAAGAFAANGYGDLSPGGYGLLACLVAEVVLTAFFLIVILGATQKSHSWGM